MKNQTTTSMFSSLSNCHSAHKVTTKSKQKGASALEYIVLAGAIAVVIAVAATAFGADVSTFFSTLLTDLTSPAQ